jgi:hypothetical protein
MGTVPAPALGLGSNHNYFIGNPGSDNKGAPIANLMVTIQIDESVVSEHGFDFQLNAYPPPDSQDKNSNWQQYVMNLDTDNPESPVIGCSVEYIGSSPFNTQSQEIGGILASNPQTLPSGYFLYINLTTDPSNGNVLTATFSFTAPPGSPAPPGPKSFNLKDLYPGSLTPMYAFQLNITGRNGGVYTYLASGSGMITYETPPESPALTVSTYQPSYTGKQTEQTGEQANSAYSLLPATPANSIPQGFWANTTSLFYRQGGYFAVSQQVGMGDQTNLYAVNQTGQLAVFSVVGNGSWTSPTLIGPIDMAHPEAKPAASLFAGWPGATAVFVADQNEQVQWFWTQDNGGWNGPFSIGPANYCSKFAFLALSPSFDLLGPVDQVRAQQTDLFVVDRNGRLNAFSMVIPCAAESWSPAWSAEPAFLGVLSPPPPHTPLHGPVGNYTSGAAIAVSPQFGATDGNQIDVFLVDKNGIMNVFWMQYGLSALPPEKRGQWSAQTLAISFPNVTFPAGACLAASQRFGVPNQTDVYAVDYHGVLHAFSVLGSGTWTDAAVGGGTSTVDLNPGAPVAVSQRFGTADETDVFVVDKTGQIWMFSSISGAAWSSPAPIGPPGIAPAANESPGGIGAFVLASQQYGVTGQTDLFVINQTGADSPGWPTMFSSNGGPWEGPNAL